MGNISDKKNMYWIFYYPILVLKMLIHLPCYIFTKPKNNTEENYSPNINIWSLFSLLFIPRHWSVWILFLTSLLWRNLNGNVMLVYLSNRLFVFVLRYFTNTKESFLPSQGDISLQLFLSYIWTGILWKSFVISLNLLLWYSSVCIEHLSPKSLGINLLRNKLGILFQST
jgi:hypothetical protein